MLLCRCCVQTLFHSRARFICQPFAPQTLLCFNANMAGSDFHYFISALLCSTLELLILLSMKEIMDLLGSVTDLAKLADACDSGGYFQMDLLVCPFESCCLLPFQKHQHPRF